MSSASRDVVRPHIRASIAGSVGLAVMLLWAVDSGGFDASTWSWGALVLLATLAGVIVAGGAHGSSMNRPLVLALGFLGAYVAWSFVSMLWAQYPGGALQGSDRALLYLIVFALFAVAPWTPAARLGAVLVYAGGIGTIAVVLLFRFAIGTHLAGLFIQGRLAAPTGYINSTAALFTAGGVTATALSARRDLPWALRSLLVGFACADLQVALTVQSRGWLFTLPIVGVAAALVAADRLRACAMAVVAVAATLVATRRLLRVYELTPARLPMEAIRAGHLGLLCCAGAFGVAALLALIESGRGRPPLSPVRRRLLGSLVAALAVTGVGVGLLAVGGGHPGRFISDQWHGFSHEQQASSQMSHFADVGSGRFDFWRVALLAFRRHPIRGLGQDNFGDYYLLHRHTGEEPLWTHSLELRLLAHTGLVGFVLFAAFLVAAAVGARRARRASGSSSQVVCGAALMPLVVWLVHGSIDWFWEMPALTGPAFGFLAMSARSDVAEPALALGSSELSASAAQDVVLGANPRRSRGPRPALAGIGFGIVLVAASAVITLPYLSDREVTLGTRASHVNTARSLHDLRLAHRLDPLSSSPGEVGGAVALLAGETRLARQLFEQAVRREPGGWFDWLGLGLSDSGLGRANRARSEFARADRIDADQLAVREALRRAGTLNPLTPAQALADINYLP